MLKQQIPWFKRLKAKMLISISSALILTIVSLTSALFYISHNMVTSNTADKAYEIAKEAAKYIDIEGFERLKTIEDEQTEAYIQMRRDLSYIREITGSRYIYTMRKTEDGDFMYVVDGSAEDEMSNIGDTEESNTDYEQAWSGQSYIGDKIEDQQEWGILISSYYPLQDNSGTVVGFIGVDYDAADVYASLQNFKRLAIIISLVCILVVLILGVSLANYITRPIVSLTKAADKLAQGDVDINIVVSESDELGQLSKSFGSMVENIKEMASAAEHIAAGDLDTEIKINSDKDLLGTKLSEMVLTIKSLLGETNNLTTQAVEGNLKARIGDENYQGSWQQLAHGINNVLDAIVEPIDEAKNVLEQMSKGNMGLLVKGNYKGDHAAIKIALNTTLQTIGSYMGETIDILSEISRGNLDVAPELEYRGDFSSMEDSLKIIINSLNNIMGDINNASQQVASGARHLSDSSQELSQGATEQAASVQEITASMMQISSQTKQNALNANKANELASTASENAKDGNAKMEGMLRAMGDINQASLNISKIIKTIDEIAFQTNILALNAAVEAARAGQHGKGFAVVAEEVRNLATRSAKAAKETTNIIEMSKKAVQSGMVIADETALALEKIVSDVTAAAQLVDEIAISSNDQATGLSYISASIDDISRVTQMNTSTAEESAAASEELTSQAEILKERVSTFKIRKAVEQDNNCKSDHRAVIDMEESFLQAAATKEDIVIELNN